MNVRPSSLLGALFVLSAACAARAPRTSSQPEPAAAVPNTEPALSAASPAVAAAPALPDLGPRGEQYLVLDDEGAVTLRSLASASSRVLAPHADAALYQAALELLWLRDGPMLKVLDLRTPAPHAVVIASGLPDINRLAIAHPTHPAETEDGCDLDAIELKWSEAPSIATEFSQPKLLRLENEAWLRAQLAREARETGARVDFGEARVRVPRAVLRCEDKESCGSALPFGASGHSLVRVQNAMGGDCWQRACLLYDPSTRLFASPPLAEGWAAAQKTEPGPCGLYRFDATRRALLIGGQLCVAPEPCRELSGVALGWLEPGDVVGAPGIFTSSSEP